MNRVWSSKSQIQRKKQKTMENLKWTCCLIFVVVELYSLPLKFFMVSSDFYITWYCQCKDHEVLPKQARHLLRKTCDVINVARKIVSLLKCPCNFLRQFYLLYNISICLKSRWNSFDEEIFLDFSIRVPLHKRQSETHSKSDHIHSGKNLTPILGNFNFNLLIISNVLNLSISPNFSTERSEGNTAFADQRAGNGFEPSVNHRHRFALTHWSWWFAFSRWIWFIPQEKKRVLQLPSQFLQVGKAPGGGCF